MADDVSVRLGAETSPLKSGMADASASIADSLAKIASALQNFGDKNKSIAEQAIRNNADLSRSFLELKASATNGFDAIAGVIQRFRGVLGTLAAALGGGLLFSEAIKTTLAFEESVRGLSIVFGVATDKATQMAVALRLAGISSDTFEGMAQRVGRVIKTQSEEFTRLGVVIKDASGNLLPMEQILQNTYRRMQDFKAGTDQLMFALSTVGRNAKDFATDMERFNAVQERSRALQQELAIEFGPDKVAMVERYRIEVNAFGVMLEDLGTKIGILVMPRLLALGKWFSEEGPGAIDAILSYVVRFVAALDVLSTGARETGLIIRNDWENTKIAAGALGGSIRILLTQGWNAAAANIEAANKRILANQLRTSAEVLGLEHDLMMRMDLLANPPRAAAAGPAAPALGAGNLPFPIKPPAAESAIAALENQLRAEQSAFNNRMIAQGSFQTWSVAQTRDYWARVLQMSTLSAKDRIEAENRYYDAERKVQQEAFAAYITHLEAEKAALGHNIEGKIALTEKEAAAVAQRYGEESKEAQAAYAKLAALRQQLADQRMKIADIEARAEEAAYRHEAEMAKLNLDQQVALRNLSKEQSLAIEQDYLTQVYIRERAALTDRMAMLAADPTSDPVELARLKSELLAVEEKYQTELTRLANAAELERKQYAIQAANDVERAFAGFIDSMVSGTKSLKDAFRDMVKQITSDLNRLASEQLAKQLFGAGTAGGGFLNDLFGKIFGGGAGGGGVAALDATSTKTSVSVTTLGLAADKAATSLALVGMPGGGGLGMLGGGGGFGAFGGLDFGGFFAEGTSYVPRDSLVVVHRGEAIVPAKYNQGAGGARSLTLQNQFVLSGPVDTRTQAQIALAIRRAVEMAQRRNA